MLRIDLPEGRKIETENRKLQVPYKKISGKIIDYNRSVKSISIH